MFWLRAATAAVVVLTTSCTAQTAPHTVAIRIYGDCIKARIMAERDIEPTRVGIIEFVERSDDWCLPWTLVWAQAFTDVDFFSRPDILMRFQSARLGLLQKLANELRDEALLGR